MRNNLSIGILAHVDAGKTTLSEGILFKTGHLRHLGRVDHQNAFLDTDAMERKRGITIFSKQAVLSLGNTTLTLLDTPGHVDFSTEMERVLQVLDYAILIVSGTDGVQGHTHTLWQLLSRYNIPAFIFINKMDLAGTDPAGLLSELQSRLSSSCVSFSDRQELDENIAMCDEDTLSEFIESGHVSTAAVIALIRQRKLFPCYFGSALKLDGIDALLRGLELYTCPPDYPAEFGAKVFKITRDAQNNRLTHLKVTGGRLAVKDTLTNSNPGLPEAQSWSEKVNQIRVYSGGKYQAVDVAEPGTVCAVAGLTHTYPGQGLGAEPASLPPSLEPFFSFRAILPEGYDPHTALRQLRQLEEEDPLIAVTWTDRTQEIYLHLMGEVQTEILSHIISERFGFSVAFDAGNILYRETVTEPVVGVGHFEPLRHYAEVHLLIEPSPRGSGLLLDTACSEDVLHRSWQRLILTHLAEREHIGVLTGAPVTDVKITLLTGRAHKKHTDGGDFRQATYRAVRQGLMQAKCCLLEPWYAFRLEIPNQAVGRAMTDLQRMADGLSLPQSGGDHTILTGKAPVASLRNYAAEVVAYTRGLGRLTCSFCGFAPCRKQDEAVAAIGYDPERDVENPSESIFCSHGAGIAVKWDKVKSYMHLDSGYGPSRGPQTPPPTEKPVRTPQLKQSFSLEQDKELQAIFERTYGPVRQRDFLPKPLPQTTKTEDTPEHQSSGGLYDGKNYLLVDGYNIIYAWEDLNAIARYSMDAARKNLMDILANYKAFRQREIILVFDAYKAPDNAGNVSRYHNISVVYTKSAETADAYIEKVTFQIGKKHRVTVASSDGTIQLIILGHGGLRITPQALRTEIEQTKADIAAIIQANNRKGSGPTILFPP